jgi:hypothetical protein
MYSLRLYQSPIPSVQPGASRFHQIYKPRSLLKRTLGGNALLLDLGVETDSMSAPHHTFHDTLGELTHRGGGRKARGIL